MKKKANKLHKLISICFCGHTGGSEGSQHANEDFEFGSGKCKECGCARFTWKRFIKV